MHPWAIAIFPSCPNRSSGSFLTSPVGTCAGDPIPIPQDPAEVAFSSPGTVYVDPDVVNNSDFSPSRRPDSLASILNLPTITQESS
jgi:hypothetical protein